MLLRICSFLMQCFEGYVCNWATSQMQEVQYLLKLDDKELKGRLSPQQFDLTQKKGNERAFTGIFWGNHKDGTYISLRSVEPRAFFIICEILIWKWLAIIFWNHPIWSSKEIVDTSHGMRRTEIVSARSAELNWATCLKMVLSQQEKDIE